MKKKIIALLIGSSIIAVLALFFYIFSPQFSFVFTPVAGLIFPMAVFGLPAPKEK